MEQVQRRKRLLVALVLGVCGLVLLLVALFVPMMVAVDQDPASLFSSTWTVIQNEELSPFWALVVIGPFTVLSIIAIGAMTLTLLAWLKSDAKKALAAGVLHVLSLNIVSAILCFVDFSKMKKTTAQVGQSE